jgi:hypothetical protein
MRRRGEIPSTRSIRRRGPFHQLVRACLIASVTAGSMPVPLALAAPSSEAPSPAALSKARALFQQALALETAGDWSGASNLFQQVAAVRLTPQVRFHLALCEEHLGNLAAALGDYQIAAEEARKVPVPEVVEQATARVEVLKARIPKLVIRRGQGAESASITLDGVNLGATSIGTELPVNPGPHTVEAQARGFRPFARTVDVSEKDRRDVEVVLQSLPPPPPEPRAVAAVAPTPSPSPAAATKPAPKSATTNYLPLVLGGLGAASLITSGVFYALRANAMSTLDGACPSRTNCPPEMQSTYDHGKTYTVVANVTLGVGLVSLGAAAALYLLGGSKGEPATASFVVEPWATGTGVQASARW